MVQVNIRQSDTLGRNTESTTERRLAMNTASIDTDDDDNGGQFSPGDAILYMKVGTHANEPLNDIIKRKQHEIDRAGYAMWGYGGNTCHPTTVVQPFARRNLALQEPIRLVMEPMDSKHFATPVRADEFSIDGVTWREIPQDINVLGSRYALCIDNLRRIESSLSLGDTRVAMGNSSGQTGSRYIRGRVDKACLDIVEGGDADRIVQIGLIADLVEPFAVFLRND